VRLSGRSRGSGFQLADPLLARRHSFQGHQLQPGQAVDHAEQGILDGRDRALRLDLLEVIANLWM
jgi:hypothetical protein